MQEKNKSIKKPLVGFFPLFFNLAETGRAVLIAKEYIKMGGRAIFFSHGGDYEYLAEEIGCKVVRIKPYYNKEFLDQVWKFSRLETLKNPFSKNLEEFVDEEVKAFKNTNVDLIVSTNNFPCIISTRVAKIPYISVTIKVIFHFSRFPDTADIIITRAVPNFIKLKILNFFAPNIKTWVRPFTKVAKKYNTPIPKNEYDLVKGDRTLYTNSPELLKIDKVKLTENEKFVGPIILDDLFKEAFKDINIEKEKLDIEKHLQRKGKTILFSFGSSGIKKLFLNVLKTLNKTNYNVIVAYTNILKENELPEVNDNILLKKIIPSITEFNKKVDLAILHGGQGTIYSAAYSGKPLIGFPMQAEQHLNLEMLSQKGTALIMSRKNYKEKDLLKNINVIFSNYEKYLENSKKLAKSLPEPIGHINCANYIWKFVQTNLKK